MLLHGECLPQGVCVCVCVRDLWQASTGAPDHQDALVQLLGTLPQRVLALLLQAQSKSAPPPGCTRMTVLCSMVLATHLVEAPLLGVKGWWKVEPISPRCRQGRHAASLGWLCLAVPGVLRQTVLCWHTPCSPGWPTGGCPGASLAVQGCCCPSPAPDAGRFLLGQCLTCRVRRQEPCENNYSAGADPQLGWPARW